MLVAWCSECGRYVAVDVEGGCSAGHPRSCLRDVHAGPAPASVAGAAPGQPFHATPGVSDEPAYAPAPARVTPAMGFATSPVPRGATKPEVDAQMSFLGRDVPPRYAYMLMAFVFAVLATGAMMAGDMANNRGLLGLGSPHGGFDRDSMFRTLIFALVWLSVLLVPLYVPRDVTPKQLKTDRQLGMSAVFSIAGSLITWATLMPISDARVSPVTAIGVTSLWAVVLLYLPIVRPWEYWNRLQAGASAEKDYSPAAILLIGFAGIAACAVWPWAVRLQGRQMTLVEWVLVPAAGVFVAGVVSLTLIWGSHDLTARQMRWRTAISRPIEFVTVMVASGFAAILLGGVIVGRLAEMVGIAGLSDIAAGRISLASIIAVVVLALLVPIMWTMVRIALLRSKLERMRTDDVKPVAGVAHTLEDEDVREKLGIRELDPAMSQSLSAALAAVAPRAGGWPVHFFAIVATSDVNAFVSTDVDYSAVVLTVPTLELRTEQLELLLVWLHERAGAGLGDEWTQGAIASAVDNRVVGAEGMVAPLVGLLETANGGLGSKWAATRSLAPFAGSAQDTARRIAALHGHRDAVEPRFEPRAWDDAMPETLQRVMDDPPVV